MTRALVFLLALSPSLAFAQTDGTAADWVIFDDGSGTKFFNSGFGDQGWDVVQYAGQYGAGTSLAYGPAGTVPVINWPAAQVPVGVYDIVVYLSPDAAPAQSVEDGTVVSSFVLTLNGTAYTVEYPVDATASHVYNGKAFGVVSSVALIGDPGQATVTVNLSAGVTLYDSSGGFIHSQWPIDVIALFKTADASGDPPADPSDCDGDGTPDADQIAADPTLDADGDGLLDSCDSYTILHDCNCNGVEDSEELDSTTDADGDGVLDACQGSALGDLIYTGGTDESGLDDAGKPKETFGGNYPVYEFDRNGDGIKDGCGSLDYNSAKAGDCCACEVLKEIRDMMRQDDSAANLVQFGKNYKDSISLPDYSDLPSEFETRPESLSVPTFTLPSVGNQTASWEFYPAGYYAPYMSNLHFSSLFQVDHLAINAGLSNWVAGVRPILRAFLLVCFVLLPGMSFVGSHLWTM